MEDVRRRCLEHPEASRAANDTTTRDGADRTEVTIPDGLTRLSAFPDINQVMLLIDRRNRRAIAKADKISIGEKRNCFLALRSQEQDIHPSSMFLPLGITVGELVVSQVISTNSERVRKD